MTTRGTALALLGLMWIGRGLVIAHDPGIPNPDEALLHLRLDVALRIGLWVGTGLIALSVCWHRKWQMLGWAAVVIMPAENAISYLWSLAMWIIPGAPGGTPWSSAYALWWVANVGLLLVMARWTEPQEDAK